MKEIKYFNDISILNPTNLKTYNFLKYFGSFVAITICDEDEAVSPL